MNTYILNFEGKNTPEELHAYWKSMLKFPDHYGANLDALYDCLTSITLPTQIKLANLNPSNPLHNAMLAVATDAASANERLKILS